jgi:dUTP pyrophosphatase
MKKTRGFEIAKGWEDKDINLPVRKTKGAAGYDIEAAEDTIIPKYEPGIKPTLIPTGLKAYCASDEYFMLVNRSSGPKKGFLMANSVGLIDSDYYENPDNDGHFFFAYFNCSDHDIEVKKGDVIGQVVFQKYLVVDNDNATGERKGGFGSTDK